MSYVLLFLLTPLIVFVVWYAAFMGVIVCIIVPWAIFIDQLFGTNLLDMCKDFIEAAKRN